MSYINSMEKVIDYIEVNIKNHIDLDMLCNISCFSKFHFHRVFKSLIGSSPITYIRQRRLSNSAKELLDTDKTILEVAIEYNYGSHETFTKAFKKKFGFTPKQCREDSIEFEVEEKVEVKKLLEKRKGVNMDVRFVIKPTFKVIGMKVRTTTKENDEFETIPKLWDRYVVRSNEIKNNKNNVDIGLCQVIEDSKDSFDYICCREVENFNFIPKEMVAKEIETCKYAVFTHRGPVDSLGESYDYIYTTWLANSNYKIKKDGHDFEVYDDRFDNSNDSILELYIPIEDII